MNKDRTVLRSKDWSQLKLEKGQLFLGNKIVMAERKQKKYFDISLNKEMFFKDGGTYYSLTDFSNFQNLWKKNSESYNNLRNVSNEDLINNPIVMPYTKLELFEPLKEGESYVAFIKEFWRYFGNQDNPLKANELLLNFNKKLIDEATKIIINKGLQTNDWFYVGGELMSKEDIIEIITCDESKLLEALASVSGQTIDTNKILKHTKRRF